MFQWYPANTGLSCFSLKVGMIFTFFCKASEFLLLVRCSQKILSIKIVKYQLNLDIIYVILYSAAGPLFISSLLSKNL